MKEYTSLEEFVQQLPGLTASATEKLRGHDGLFELRCGEKRWFVTLADGHVTVSEESDTCPLCIVEAQEKLLLDMVCGRVSPMKALLFGKVTVRGDVKPLLRLCSLLQ